MRPHSLVRALAGALLVAGAATAQSPARAAQPASGSPDRSALHPSPGRISAEQAVSGALDTADPVTFDGTAYDDWIYTGKAGERLSIALRSTAFDSYLQFGTLGEGQFSYIGAEDDGAGGNDSLYEITLPADGEYVIRANTLFAGHGPYTIQVTRR